MFRWNKVSIPDLVNKLHKVGSIPKVITIFLMLSVRGPSKRNSKGISTCHTW